MEMEMTSGTLKVHTEAIPYPRSGMLAFWGYLFLPLLPWLVKAKLGT